MCVAGARGGPGPGWRGRRPAACCGAAAFNDALAAAAARSPQRGPCAATGRPADAPLCCARHAPHAAPAPVCRVHGSHPAVRVELRGREEGVRSHCKCTRPACELTEARTLAHPTALAALLCLQRPPRAHPRARHPADLAQQCGGAGGRPYKASPLRSTRRRRVTPVHWLWIDCTAALAVRRICGSQPTVTLTRCVLPANPHSFCRTWLR